LEWQAQKFTPLARNFVLDHLTLLFFQTKFFGFLCDGRNRVPSNPFFVRSSFWRLFISFEYQLSFRLLQEDIVGKDSFPVARSHRPEIVYFCLRTQPNGPHGFSPTLFIF